MKRIISLFLIFLNVFAVSGCFSGCVKTDKKEYSFYSFNYFDTATTVIGYEGSKEEFDAVCNKIDRQLQEYHRLYTTYDRYENINNLCVVNDVNDGKHNTVEVDQKIIELLLYGREMYYKTKGKMNIAMGSVLSIWHDYRTAGIDAPSNARLPEMKMLKEAAEHTDIEKMIIDTKNNTVFLSDPKMKLDVGAVAKGYAVEAVAKWMENEGIEGYVLNVGGNVRVIGAKPGDKAWKIGIENPDTNDASKPYIAYLSLKDKSVVTSGAYQRYYTVDKKRYHHIIDPDTLMPGNNYQSVSVLCDNSAQGDALSTALFSMTFEQGLKLVESMPDTQALWVFTDGEIKTSSGMPI